MDLPRGYIQKQDMKIVRRIHVVEIGPCWQAANIKSAFARVPDCVKCSDVEISDDGLIVEFTFVEEIATE